MSNIHKIIMNAAMTATLLVFWIFVWAGVEPEQKNKERKKGYYAALIKNVIIDFNKN